MFIKIPLQQTTIFLDVVCVLVGDSITMEIIELERHHSLFYCLYKEGKVMNIPLRKYTNFQEESTTMPSIKFCSLYVLLNLNTNIFLSYVNLLFLYDKEKHS